VTQIAKADRINREKTAAMRKMHALLADVDELILPAGIGDSHGAHLYVVRVKGIARDAVAKHLKDQYQVGTAHHYPIVWTWEAFDDLDYDKINCDLAVDASEHAISLPVFAQSTGDDLQYVAWALKQTISELA